MRSSGTMSTPQAKRRRLNEATKTLQRPFKSPFRTPLKPNLGSDPPSSDPSTTESPSTSSISSHDLVPKPRVNVVKTPISRLSNPAAVKKTPSNTSLTREIMQMRNEIQMLSQAHALASSSKDEDLGILTDRWRTASRAAAEELFATTRDRVNRMGGVGAWKEREKEQQEWRMKADREELEAEREKLHEARENGEISEEAYEQFVDVQAGVDPEDEKESFKTADDDVSPKLQIRF